MAWHVCADDGEMAVSYYLPTEPSEVYPGMSFSVTYSITSKRNTMLAFVPVMYSTYADTSYTIGAFSNINLGPGRTGTYTATFTMPSDWIKGHIGSFRFGGTANFAGWGGSCGSNDSYTYVSYRLQPKIMEMDFERSDMNGNWENDGLYLRCRILKGTISSKGNASDVSKAVIKVAGYDAGTLVSGTEKTITLSQAQIASVLSSNGYTEAKPTLFSGFVTQAGLDYTATITFGDDFDQSIYSDGIMRSFARLHLSGAKKGGVAVGMFSTATDTEPKFEVAHDHESIFHGGIRGMTNYTSGEVATGGHWIDGRPIYRYVKVYNITCDQCRTWAVIDTLTDVTIDFLIWDRSRYAGHWFLGNPDNIRSNTGVAFDESNMSLWSFNGYGITGNTPVRIILDIEYVKPLPGSDPPSRDKPSMIRFDPIPDKAIARTDYIAMMSGIEIPDDAETNAGPGTQSDPNGVETPGIGGEPAPSAKYDAVARYYEYDCWSAAMVRNAVGRWITADEAESIFDRKTTNEEECT